MQQEELRTVQQKQVCWGLATVYKLRNGSTRFRFSIIRILSVCLVAFVIGWISLFSAAFIHFKYRRGYDEASYIETLFFPFTHKNFQKKRGDYYIATAYSALEEGDYKKALNLLRNGLLRSPDDLEARQTLSEFYEFLFNQPKLAFDLLADGIPFLRQKETSAQNDYIQYLFALGSRNQLDEKLIEVGISLQNELGDQLSETMMALIHYQLASAYRNKGEVDASSKQLEEYNLSRFSEGLVLQAQLLWDRGDEESSIQLLESRLNQYKDNRPIYEKIIALLEEKQQVDRARQYSILYQLAYPQVFQSHLARLQHYYKYNREKHELLDGFIHEYTTDFSGNPIALRQLAILTSKYGDVTNTREVLQFSTTDPSDASKLLSEFILIEAMIRSQQYDQALADLDQIESRYSDSTPLNPDSNSILLSLKTAAYYGKGQMAEANQTLNKLLESPVIKIDRYLAVAYLFLEVDAPDIALRIMDHCKQTQVYNANVMEALLAIHIKSGDVKQLSDILDQAIDTRRLPNRLLIESYRLLSSDRNIHLRNRQEVMDKIQQCFSTDYLFKDPQV